MASTNGVLFVDDEKNVISALRRAVSEEPYYAAFAGSAREALQIMEEREISVIVTDMRMPEMDGLTLLRILRDKYPHTVRMVLTSYIHLPQIQAAVNQGEIYRLIAKPWRTEDELLPAVRQAVEYYNLQEAGPPAYPPPAVP